MTLTADERLREVNINLSATAQEAIGHACDYAADAGDSEVVEEISRLFDLVNERSESMDFTLALRVLCAPDLAVRLGAADYTDEQMREQGIEITTADESAAVRTLSFGSSFKVAFVEGVAGDYAAPESWDDLRVRSGGYKLSVGTAMVLGHMLGRLAARNGGGTPMVKAGLRYRSP